MSSVYALIPARVGSKGIPNKNFRLLNDASPLSRAIHVARCVTGCEPIVSSDFRPDHPGVYTERHANAITNQAVTWLACEPPLHTDTCPMIDVVKDALARVPGEPDDIWLLVQPSQPLREPKHLKAAITLLQESQAHSVVSVVEVPAVYHPDVVFLKWPDGSISPQSEYYRWATLPTRRQEHEPMYVRDGTVYAFWRETVDVHGTIYGELVKPLIIPASETQPLDTLEDWAEAERRLREREAIAHR